MSDAVLQLLRRPDVWMLVTGVVAVLTAANAHRPLRSGAAGTASFFLGWLTTELALHHVAWQLLWVVALAFLGGLDRWPGVVGLGLWTIAWVALVRQHRRGHLALEATRAAFAEVGLPHEPLDRPDVGLVAAALPFAVTRSEVAHARVAHHHAGGHVLHADVLYRKDVPTGAPVLVYVHGGGWVIGYKRYQGLPLLHALAAAGWVCVSVDYRLSPGATFPDHLVDVKRGLAWARQHAPTWGGDPRFVALAGNSAGAHLAALAALTPNEPAWQPGFEADDTRVDALVGLYGVYDLLDRFGHWPGTGLRLLWERVIAKRKVDEDPDFFRTASPIDHVSADAPPTLLIHGTLDALAPVDESRRFAEALRAVSTAPVVLAEIDGAQHAFEIFHSVRGRYAVQAVVHFLEVIRARRKARDEGDGVP